jgi:hypothetical protein
MASRLSAHRMTDARHALVDVMHRSMHLVVSYTAGHIMNLPRSLVALFVLLSVLLLGTPDVACAEVDCIPLLGSEFYRTPGVSPYNILPVTATAAFPESLHIELTAQLTPAPYKILCFGDTDHDGKGEVMCRFHIFEAQGGTVYTGDDLLLNVYPYATGDLDRDGKSDLIGQYAYQVKVYESVDANSYPSQLVWVSQDLSNVLGDPTIGDTDVDGRMEIIHSVNTFGNYADLRFFENTGDNSYAQVCSLVTSTGAHGNKVIADLDFDGIPEIAWGTLKGGVYVVKSDGNNAWRFQWTTGTDLAGAYSACVGPDLDGNGKPELFILGNGPYPQGWKTIVFESSGPDTYAPVATFSQYDGWGGKSSNAVGNLTGSGRLEYLMQGHDAAWICFASAPGQWDFISELPNTDHQHRGLYPVDLNHNGRDELVWASEGSDTSVYEQRAWVADVQFPPPGSVERLVVVPNPARWEAALQLPLSYPAGSRLHVYDAAGRLVQGLPLAPTGTQAHWRTDGLGAGVYFVQIQGAQGKPLARGQVTVVR